VKIGYQLYSAKDLFCDSKGLVAVLEKLASFGYDGVEFFNYTDMSANDLKTILAMNHLEAINSHVSLERFRNNMETEIAYAQVLGLSALTIPYHNPEQRSEADYRALFKDMPKFIAACDKVGIKLCYHNHDFEFEKIDDMTVLDFFLSIDNLFLELDTFWAWFAGLNPISYIEKYAGRTPYIHIKDYLDRNTTPPVFCAIGTGKMDNRGIVDAAGKNGIQWIVVEQDNDRINPMESARLSVEHLRKMGL
jgi:sugar phosphate isomerase/epimerase